MSTATFQTGQTYTARSACNHDCVFSFRVVSRTAKFVTLASYGNEDARVGIKIYDGVEHALPMGSFSMAPSIHADRAGTQRGE